MPRSFENTSMQSRRKAAPTTQSALQSSANSFHILSNCLRSFLVGRPVPRSRCMRDRAMDCFLEHPYSLGGVRSL